jgi:hypothetical protein
MLNFKDLEEMKKVLLFCVVALAFASCAPKAAETAPAADSTAVTVTLLLLIQLLLILLLMIQ